MPERHRILQQEIRWRADWASLRSGFGISKLQFIKIRPEKENCFGTIEAHSHLPYISHLPYRVASVLIQSCWLRGCTIRSRQQRARGGEFKDLRQKVMYGTTRWTLLVRFSTVGGERGPDTLFVSLFKLHTMKISQRWKEHIIIMASNISVALIRLV